MKIVEMDMVIYELNELEIKRFLGIPENYQIVDAKIIERAKDPRNPEHKVLGLRFTRRSPDVRRINLEHHQETVDAAKVPRPA